MIYISLKEATKYCNYSQDYLKLRARQGKLKAVKIGRNWATTREWVEEYKNKIQIPKSQIPKYYIWGLVAILAILIFVGILMNFSVFMDYFQWQTANISGVFDKGLRIIPERVIEVR